MRGPLMRRPSTGDEISATIGRSEEGYQSPRGLVTLLALAIFINYIDRGNLATAVPVIKNELHLSTTQIGFLLGAFFWTYMPMQLGAGWLAERFAVHRVIAAGFALWLIATMLTGLVSGFAALLGMRLLLGLGESVAFPCSSKLLAQHVKTERRGRANGALGVGLALGPAFGTFGGGLILARFGWRTLFISLGALSLLWLWPWLTAPGAHPFRRSEHFGGFGTIVSRDFAPPSSVGCGARTLLCQLQFLFCPELVAALFGERSRFVDRAHGSTRRRCLSLPGSDSVCHRVDTRPLDSNRRDAESRLQDRDGDRPVSDRYMPVGSADSRTKALRRVLAVMRRDLWSYDTASVRQCPDISRSDCSWSLDGFPELRGESRRCRGAPYHGLPDRSRWEFLLRICFGYFGRARWDAVVAHDRAAYRPGDVGRPSCATPRLSMSGMGVMRSPPGSCARVSGSEPASCEADRVSPLWALRPPEKKRDFRSRPTTFSNWSTRRLVYSIAVVVIGAPAPTSLNPPRVESAPSRIRF